MQHEVFICDGCGGEVASDAVTTITLRTGSPGRPPKFDLCPHCFKLHAAGEIDLAAGAAKAITARKPQQQVGAAPPSTEVRSEPDPELLTSERGRLVRKAVDAWTGQLVDLGGRNNLLFYRDLKAGTLDLGSSGETQPIPDFSREAVERLATTSRTAAGEEVERRSSLFRLDNEAHFDAERTRLEKLFRFQEHHFEQRIARVEGQIGRLSEFGTESERRVIPALKGRIEQDRGRLAAVGEERDLALGQLEARRVPGEQIRILGVVAFEPAAEAPTGAPSREEAHVPD